MKYEHKKNIHKYCSLPSPSEAVHAMVNRLGCGLMSWRHSGTGGPPSRDRRVTLFEKKQGSPPRTISNCSCPKDRPTNPSVRRKIRWYEVILFPVYSGDWLSGTIYVCTNKLLSAINCHDDRWQTFIVFLTFIHFLPGPGTYTIYINYNYRDAQNCLRWGTAGPNFSQPCTQHLVNNL